MALTLPDLYISIMAFHVSRLVFSQSSSNAYDAGLQDIQDGVYITSVTGLHAGLNPQSGNFSLQSSGFLVKNGKIDRPLDVITVSGNLVEIFKDVQEVGSDVKVFPSAVSCSSLQIKKIVVSGK